MTTGLMEREETRANLIGCAQVLRVLEESLKARDLAEHAWVAGAVASALEGAR